MNVTSTRILQRGVCLRVNVDLRDGSKASFIRFASKRAGNLAREKLAAQLYRAQ
jgi:hypothetical protein